MNMRVWQGVCASRTLAIRGRRPCFTLAWNLVLLFPLLIFLLFLILFFLLPLRFLIPLSLPPVPPPNFPAPLHLFYSFYILLLIFLLLFVPLFTTFIIIFFLFFFSSPSSFHSSTLLFLFSGSIYQHSSRKFQPLTFSSFKHPLTNSAIYTNPHIH